MKGIFLRGDGQHCQSCGEPNNSPNYLCEHCLAGISARVFDNPPRTTERDKFILKLTVRPRPRNA